MRISAVVALGGVRCATRCGGQQPQQGVLGVRSPVSWCVATAQLHDEREERSDDVPTEVVVGDGEALWLTEEE